MKLVSSHICEECLSYGPFLSLRRYRSEFLPLDLQQLGGHLKGSITLIDRCADSHWPMARSIMKSGPMTQNTARFNLSRNRSKCPSDGDCTLMQIDVQQQRKMVRRQVHTISQGPRPSDLIIHCWLVSLEIMEVSKEFFGSEDQGQCLPSSVKKIGK